MLAAAAALAGALIVASQVGASRDGARREQPRTARLFAGIPQHGAVLGRPSAPVTLVEYADLQCPYCAEWARRTLPVLVADYVRTGQLRIVFRGLAFLGPDSTLALQTAVAAGLRDRLWDIVEALYLSQGAENSGWVTDRLLAEISARAGLSYDDVAAARSGPKVQRAILRDSAHARTAGVSGTPFFQLGRTNGRFVHVTLQSLGPEGLTPAIDALLVR